MYTKKINSILKYATIINYLILDTSFYLQGQIDSNETFPLF